MKVTFEKANEIMRNARKENLYAKLPEGLSNTEAFFYKVRNDFVWYAENFLKIRDKNSQLIPFRINEAQIMVEALDQYCKQNGIMRRYIILKARQMGMSTYTEGKLFHSASTTELKNSSIIAHEDKATQNLFAMSKLFYEELPDVIRPMKKQNNEKALSFENPTTDESEKKRNPGLRSKYSLNTANTVEAGRSSTIHNLHASEVAFFPNAKVTMTGLLQTVPDTLDTLVVFESTANGVGDYFYTQWQRAMKGESDFIPIFLPWFTDSTYKKEFQSDAEKDAFIASVNHVSKDGQGNEVHTEEYELMRQHDLTYEQLNWRRWAIANKCNGDEDDFRQEYPSTPEEAFISTGRPRFNHKVLREYSKYAEEPLKRGYLRETEGGSIYFEEDKNGYIAIWKEPEESKSYCIGADVAEGLAEGDYSVGMVGDYDFNVVASWYGHIDPDLFGEEMVKLARYYNDAYLGVESNNHGLATLKAIQRKEYWNIYYQKTYDKITDKLSQKMGWQTNQRTKPLMIDKLAEFVREKYIGIKWKTLIDEMRTYIIEDNGSTNAQLGCHDDTVMATAIMLQVLLEGKGENYAPEFPNEKKTKVKQSEFQDIIDDLFEQEETCECT